MYFLIKIGKSEHVEDMYEKEYLYFNKLSSFRSTHHDPSGRLDSKELNLSNIQLARLTLKRDDLEINFHNQDNFSAQLMENLDNPDIACCSMIFFEWFINETTSLNPRLKYLGDKALVIHDPMKFYRILDENLESKKLQYSRKKVTYYNPKTHDGDLTLHHKNDKYSYQNEYRLLVLPVHENSIKIQISGLKKISFLIDSKDLNTMR